MLRTILSLLVAMMVLPVWGGSKKAGPVVPDYDLREGDIVFQGNPGAQSDAIRDATGSPFTHCGVVFRHEGRWHVVEAVQPVRTTPLDQWIGRSLPGTYRAYRLKQELEAGGVEKARAWAGRQLGKDYDLKFRWDEGALYCSEFVWKLYREGGIELCRPKTFRDYKLDAPTVKAIIDQRYGGLGNLPLDETVVAPGDLVQSPLLVEAPRQAAKRID